MRGRWPPPIPRAAPRFLEASQCPAHALAARPKRPAGRATPRAARTMSPPTRPTVATFPPKPRRGRPREGSCPLGLQLPCQSPQGWRKGKKSVRPPGTEPAITRLPYRAPSTRAGSSGTGGRGHPDAEHLAGGGALGAARQAPRPRSSGAWLGLAQEGRATWWPMVVPGVPRLGWLPGPGAARPESPRRHGRSTGVGREEALARSARGPRPRGPRGRIHPLREAGEAGVEHAGAPLGAARSGRRGEAAGPRPAQIGRAHV